MCYSLQEQNNVYGKYSNMFACKKPTQVKKRQETNYLELTCILDSLWERGQEVCTHISCICSSPFHIRQQSKHARLLAGCLHSKLPPSKWRALKHYVLVSNVWATQQVCSVQCAVYLYPRLNGILILCMHVSSSKPCYWNAVSLCV